MGAEPTCPTSLVMECNVEDEEISLPVGRFSCFIVAIVRMEAGALWCVAVVSTRDKERMVGVVRATDELGVWRMVRNRALVAANEVIERL